MIAKSHNDVTLGDILLGSKWIDVESEFDPGFCVYGDSECKSFSSLVFGPLLVLGITTPYIDKKFSKWFVCKVLAGNGVVWTYLSPEYIFYVG